MSEDKGPDWMAELAKGGEELRRQIEPLVQTAEQFVRDARRAKARGCAPLPFAQRVALAAAELIQQPKRPVAHERTASLTVTPVMTATATVTGSLTLELRPMRLAAQGTVEPRHGQAERPVGQILALVLVAIVASGLLGVQGPDRAAVDHYLTVLSFALPIAVLIWSKQNKQK